MRTTTTLLAALMLCSAANAWAQAASTQPSVPNAYYGRDGFWHCKEGYAVGESGQCEVQKDGWRHSAYTRLNHDHEQSLISEGMQEY